MSRFEDVFERVIGIEGGYTCDEHDPGGETKYGISKRSYPAEDIANLTLDRAKEIYLADFWNALRCDDIGTPLDEFIFDYAVNSGSRHVALALQEAVGALRDGNIGPRTLDAIRSRPALQTLRLLFVDRAMTFALSKNDERYGHGWFARLFDKTVLALREI